MVSVGASYSGANEEKGTVAGDGADDAEENDDYYDAAGASVEGKIGHLDVEKEEKVMSYAD